MMLGALWLWLQEGLLNPCDRSHKRLQLDFSRAANREEGVRQSNTEKQ
jgi:hypothetical protein